MFLKRRTPKNEQIIKKTCKHSVVIMLLVSCICVGTVTTSAALSGTTVYFKNTDNWSAVYCYSWVDGGDDKAWPGTAMTDEGNGISAMYLQRPATRLFSTTTAEHRPIP